MPRPKKTYPSVMTTVRISSGAYARLVEKCRKEGIRQADVMRMGIRLFLSGKRKPTLRDTLE